MDAVEPAVAVVGGGGVRFAGPEVQAGVCFPGVLEASGCGELDVGDGVAPVGEHAASADGGELVGVADGDESPSVLAYQVDQVGEVVGAGHAGFVEDHRRPHRQRGGGVGMAGEEAGHRFGRTARLGAEDVCGLTGWRQSDYGASCGVQLGDGFGGCGGLAGPGRPDDHDQLGGAGHGGGRAGGRVAGVGCRLVGCGAGPSLKVPFLFKDRSGAEPVVGDVLQDRPSVLSTRPVPGDVWGQVVAMPLGLFGELVDALDEFRC